MDNVRSSAIETVWWAVLGMEQGDPQDNFFELGGDSLLALELMERLERQIPVAFPVEAFFSDASLAALTQSYILLLAS